MHSVLILEREMYLPLFITPESYTVSILLKSEKSDCYLLNSKYFTTFAIQFYSNAKIMGSNFAKPLAVDEYNKFYKNYKYHD